MLSPMAISENPKESEVIDRLCSGSWVGYILGSLFSHLSNICIVTSMSVTAVMLSVYISIKARSKLCPDAPQYRKLGSLLYCLMLMKIIFLINMSFGIGVEIFRCDEYARAPFYSPYLILGDCIGCVILVFTLSTISNKMEVYSRLLTESQKRFFGVAIFFGFTFIATTVLFSITNGTPPMLEFYMYNGLLYFGVFSCCIIPMVVHLSSNAAS